LLGISTTIFGSFVWIFLFHPIGFLNIKFFMMCSKNKTTQIAKKCQDAMGLCVVSY
jgi:hypothetical protein